MIVVHPMDYPLFKAFFDGTLDIDRFANKRVELHQRHEKGESLQSLIEDAEAFAGRVTEPRGLLGKQAAEKPLIAAANRSLKNLFERER